MTKRKAASAENAAEKQQNVATETPQNGPTSDAPAPKQSETAARSVTLHTVGLTGGERHLVVRALRYYISAERSAIQNAALAARPAPGKKPNAKAVANAEDVKRHAGQHIEAAEQLITKLRDNFRFDESNPTE